jgi:hypothetical protein
MDEWVCRVKTFSGGKFEGPQQADIRAKHADTDQPASDTIRLIAYGLIVSGVSTQLITAAPNQALATAVLIAAGIEIAATLGRATVLIITGRDLALNRAPSRTDTPGA